MLKLSDLNLSIETTKLKNGLKIVHFRHPGAPLAIRCLFFAGSRFDTTEGTSHFLEHMLVAGTKKYPSKDKLTSFVENSGGSLGATTSSDILAINLSFGDPKDVSIASETLKEILFESTFEPKTIESERGAIYRELSDKKSNSAKAIGLANRHLFFQNTILGRSNLGTEESIKNITQKSLVSHYQQNILSGQAVLVTSGDITIKTLQKEFKFLEKIKLVAKVPKKDLELDRQKRILIEKVDQNDQITFSYGFRVGNIYDTSNPALTVILSALATNKSSKLITNLRYKNGLIYSINSWYDQFFDSGVWGFQTSTSKSNFQRVITIIESEFNSLAKNGLTSKDLQFIKNKIIKTVRLRLQSSESIVNFHAYKQFIDSQNPWTIEDYVKEIEKVTNRQVLETINKYLTPNKSYLAVCGNVSEADIKLS